MRAQGRYYAKLQGIQQEAGPVGFYLKALKGVLLLGPRFSFLDPRPWPSFLGVLFLGVLFLDTSGTEKFKPKPTLNEENDPWRPISLLDQHRSKIRTQRRCLGSLTVEQHEILASWQELRPGS